MVETVYKLGRHMKSMTNFSVIIHLQLLDDTATNFEEPKHTCISQQYKMCKISSAKVEKITDLELDEEFNKAYVPSELLENNRSICFQKGKIINFRNYDFDSPKMDYGAIWVFRTLEGVYNWSDYVPDGFTGTRLKFYDSGLLRFKRNYSAGSKIAEYGFKNTLYNPLKYIFNFENDEINLEYVYDHDTVLGIFYFNDNKVVHVENYLKDKQLFSHYEKLYL